MKEEINKIDFCIKEDTKEKREICLHTEENKNVWNLMRRDVFCELSRHYRK